VAVALWKAPTPGRYWNVSRAAVRLLANDVAAAAEIGGIVEFPLA
jgi:hypothetical protein